MKKIPCFGVLGDLILSFSKLLNQKASHQPSGQYALDEEYYKRIEAIQFTMNHDDGNLVKEIKESDIILLGVSRTSKTPTAIFLANKGFKTSNIPLINENSLPEVLKENPKISCIIGLNTEPERLVEIRKNRMNSLKENKNKLYTDLEQIKKEVDMAKNTFKKYKWPFIDVTRKSVEETAASVIKIYEIYKEKADKIFSTNEISKQDIIRGQKLYKKSKKLKRSRELIKERLNIYKTNIERLEEFTTLLENLNSLNNEKLSMRIKLLEEIMEEICNEFNINIKKQREDQKSTYEIESSPILVDTPTGLKLQVGRNMRQNDLISFKFSKKGDLWFHAQESPGSHVVLKSSSQAASEQDLQIAADLAALFSKAKRNIKVPINLVKIKDLQKIKKGGQGCVSFKNGEIIWGNPTRGEDYIKKNLKTVI